MQPLAFKLRPQTLKDVVGQDHLLGENGPIRKMIHTNNLSSLILYGNPGIGKTTISECIVNELNGVHFKFNASTDNKKTLTDIIAHAKMYNIIVIIDEIHRMKKDIQDYLLPFVEAGSVTIIGLTTVNPYHSVNPAIRSRTLIYKLNDITHENIMIVLKRALNKYYPNTEVSEDALKLISEVASNDLRIALNILEATLNINNENNVITIEHVKEVAQTAAVKIDKDTDLYYDALSGLQKSIRGSDVDASLYYLGLLLSSDDLLSIVRRLWVIAYEDIGLANPQIGPRAKAAGDTALLLGMPEARIPLATLVVDMALSPKSNSAYLGIEKALKDISDGKGGPLPPHLKNTYDFGDAQAVYKYPHDYPGFWVNQQYLPDNLLNASYYEPKESSKYEKALMERYNLINKAKRK